MFMVVSIYVWSCLYMNKVLINDIYEYCECVMLVVFISKFVHTFFCGQILFDHFCIRTYEDYDDIQDLWDDKDDVERIEPNPYMHTRR